MSKELQKFTATYIQLYDRKIEPIKKDGLDVITNDIDNLYPNRVEMIENQSSTAKACALRLKQYLFGNGFEIPTKIQVKTLGNKVVDGNYILEKICNSLKTHRGAFIHINYDAEGNVNYVDVLNYKRCRVVKSDHKGNSGIVINKDWTDTKKFTFGKKSLDFKWYYPFNNDLSAINSQRNNDTPNSEIIDKIKNYRGQVYFFKLDDNEFYPNAWLTHQAMNDANSEFNLSLYINSNFRNGFMEKTMFVAQEPQDQSVKGEMINSIKSMLGVDNAGTVPVIFMENMGQDVKEVFSTISVKSNFDPEKYTSIFNDLKDSIRMCYLVPSALINSNDNSLFGNSGEMLKEVQRLYSNELKGYRTKVEGLFKELFNDDFKITPLC